MKRIQVTLFFLVAISFHNESRAFQSKANYDDTKIPAYELPELLECNDGTQIRTKEEWTAKRRGEILELFKTHVYGTMPAAPPKSFRPQIEVVKTTTIKIVVDPQRENGEMVDVRLKEVKISLGSEASAPVANLLLLLPTKPNLHGAHPVFLAYNFQGNHSVLHSPEITKNQIWNRERERVIPDDATRGISSSRWPIGMIVKRGYGVATMYYGDIDPDFDDGFKNGIHALYPKLQERSDNWASIGAWAWGAHRAMDYFEVDSDVDQTRVAMMGHSRLGKTALWAGATDERFAVVISNNSGCGGAALARRRIGETVTRINEKFPHWFCKKHKLYGDNENTMPVDQHMLIALMAPRAVYIASAEEDRWADPHGEFLSAFHAQPAWELFNQKGLGLTKPDMPEIESPLGHRVGYHIRKGKHGVKAYDWELFLNFFRANTNGDPETE